MAPHRSKVVTRSRRHSPAASSHGCGCGYESPTEHHQPAHSAAPSPAPSIYRAHVPASAAPAAGSLAGLGPGPGPVARPAFSSRPSYASAMPFEGHSPSVHFSLEWPSNHSSLNDMIAKADKMHLNARVTLRDRIACYQWTYFTMTMATGGIANVLHALSYRASWITALGVFFCILNITLFLLSCLLITTRFCLRPGSFINSFTDQVESLFIPAFFVSIAIILINICEYGVPHAGLWLLRTLEVMFWFYVALSAAASAGIYLILWSTLSVLPPHLDEAPPRRPHSLTGGQRLPRAHDDANLGLPRISPPPHCALRRQPRRRRPGVGPPPFRQHDGRRPRRRYHAGHGLPHRLHDLCRLPLSPHDAEAAEGHAEARRRRPAPPLLPLRGKRLPADLAASSCR